MKITKSIREFIDEAATLASKYSDLPKAGFIPEYIKQILEDDYYYLVNWANYNNISIPAKLKHAIDDNY